MVDYEISCIVKYIEEFGFEKRIFFVPKNKFEYYRENLYDWIYYNLSKKFYTMLDNFSPVEFIERFEKMPLYCLRNCEGEVIKHISIGNCYLTPYGIRIEYYRETWLYTAVTLKCDINSTGNNLNLVYKLLCDDPEMLCIIRDRKLKSILS